MTGKGCCGGGGGSKAEDSKRKHRTSDGVARGTKFWNILRLSDIIKAAPENIAQDCLQMTQLSVI